jgi:hypothetical protein
LSEVNARPHASEGDMQRIVAFFENMTPQDLPQLGRVYATDARFKDPFNDVRGLARIEAVYAHMYRTLDAPHFVVRERMLDGPQVFLSWDFQFRFKNDAHWQTIHGATYLQLDAQGLITQHRDYWDAAEELYEKLPVLGGLMRWLKRRVAG